MIKRILVIDDDPDIGLMIKLMLEFRGYWVKVVDRADNVSGLIQESRIDLLIMDMLLSGVNGVDICSQIRADPATDQVKIIMISAHPNAREMCLLAGADDFLAKPFDMDELLSRLHRVESLTD